MILEKMKNGILPRSLIQMKNGKEYTIKFSKQAVFFMKLENGWFTYGLGNDKIYSHEPSGMTYVF